ncbi:unnamed protein product, partial [Meganyctiphanes norvegica]
VIRGWCPDEGCGGEQALDDHLLALPQESLVIIMDLRSGYRYLMTRPGDAVANLKSAVHDAVLAPHPLKFDQILEVIQNKDTANSKENKKEEINDVSIDDSEMHNEVSNKKEELKKEITEIKVYQNILKLVLEGGVAIGQVGALHKALQGKVQALGNALIDNQASFVLFSELQPGSLGFSSDLKATFIHDGGSEENEKNPIMVISDKADNLNVYNTIQAMVQYTDTSCSYTNTISENNEGTSNGRIAVVMTVGSNPVTPYFEEVLQGLVDQDYLKTLIHLTITTKNTSEIQELDNFFKHHSSSYGSLRLQEEDPDENVMTVCHGIDCTAVIIMSTLALLKDPNTLTRLMESRRPLVAPLLASKGKEILYNYNYDENDDNEASTNPFDQLIKERVIRGIVKVSSVKEFVVIKRKAIDDMVRGLKVGTFLDTRQTVGQMVDPRSIPEGKLYPSIWSAHQNPNLWTKRYISPELLEITSGKKQPEKV